SALRTAFESALVEKLTRTTTSLLQTCRPLVSVKVAFEAAVMMICGPPVPGAGVTCGEAIATTRDANNSSTVSGARKLVIERAQLIKSFQDCQEAISLRYSSRKSALGISLAMSCDGYAWESNSDMPSL